MQWLESREEKKATMEYVLISGICITSQNVLLVTQSYKEIGTGEGSEGQEDDLDNEGEE